MGRTIASFRQLIEIEKLYCSPYKKLLPAKKDKKHLVGYLKAPDCMLHICPMP